jgi:tetratricopeptide (TPR) repeat protein
MSVKDFFEWLKQKMGLKTPNRVAAHCTTWDAHPPTAQRFEAFVAAYLSPDVGNTMPVQLACPRPSGGCSESLLTPRTEEGLQAREPPCNDLFTRHSPSVPRNGGVSMQIPLGVSVSSREHDHAFGSSSSGLPPMNSDQHTNADRELLDAGRVDEALRRMQVCDNSTAFQLLSAVIANAPDEYTYQYEQDGTLHVKFWDKEEFLHYVTWWTAQGHGRNVAWKASAYPRACYYLAFLRVEAGECQAALELLDKGERLEPSNIKFTIERAQIYARMGRHPEALELLDQVHSLGPHVSGRHVARALRGKGVILIDLGNFVLAERYLRQSLEYEPTSEVAVRELAYIRHLRGGGEASWAQLSRNRGADLNRCMQCGQVIAAGEAHNIEGNVVILCAPCHRKLTTN